LKITENMPKSYKCLQVGTRSSLGIRTRSGKKCFDSATLVGKYTKCILAKASPIKTVTKSSKTVKKPRKRNNKPASSLYNKKYKFQLKKRIEDRKTEYGLKRASSRLAAKYFLTDDLCNKRQELIKAYMRLKKCELESILRKNKQFSEGTKMELAGMIADGILYGASPVCPHCGERHLDFNFYTGTYTCRGNYEDEVECKASFEFQDIINLVKPWKC